LEASIAPPEVAPAPMTVWISSMNSIGARHILELLDHLLEAFLEITAIAGAGQQRRPCRAKDHRIGEHFRHVAIDDALGQALGDGRLADAGIADESGLFLDRRQRTWMVRLTSSIAADQRIDLAGLGLLVEIDAVSCQRILALLLAAFLAGLIGLGRIQGLLLAPRTVRPSPTPGAWRCRAR
jgi:hypothetical protein